MTFFINENISTESKKKKKTKPNTPLFASIFDLLFDIDNDQYLFGSL